MLNIFCLPLHIQYSPFHPAPRTGRPTFRDCMNGFLPLGFLLDTVTGRCQQEIQEIRGWEEREDRTFIPLAPSLPDCSLRGCDLSPGHSSARHPFLQHRYQRAPVTQGSRWTQVLEGPLLAFLNPTVMS